MALLDLQVKMTEVEALYSMDNSFWEAYIAGRPPMPASYFNRIFKYHAEHGGHFGTAHDVGAGAGVHSARFTDRFTKVIVSDPSETNIHAARSHLLGPQYDFHVVKLEDTNSVLPPSSVDLIFAGTCLHFCDIPKALEAVAHQLRPGGSFVVSCAGIVRLTDETAQKAYLDVFHTGVSHAIEQTGRAITPNLIINASGYDRVALPSAYFQSNALRWKLNDLAVDIAGGHYYLTSLGPDLRKDYPPLSRIASTENVVHEVDEDLAFRKDFPALMAHLQSFPFDMEDETVNPKVKAREDAVRGREMDGYWVIHTILATRK